MKEAIKERKMKGLTKMIEWRKETKEKDMKEAIEEKEEKDLTEVIE